MKPILTLLAQARREFGIIGLLGECILLPACLFTTLLAAALLLPELPFVG